MVQMWLKTSEYQVPSGRDELLTAVVKTGVKLWSKVTDDDERFKTLTERFDITLTDSVLTNVPREDLSQEQYEAELSRYNRPHFHFTDEIRYVKDGGCYIDIEVADQVYVRVHLSGGEAIVIPAGVFHCVSLDEGKYVKAAGYYKSKGLDNDYVPRYDYDVRSLIEDCMEKSQKVA